ncbi:MAG: hypothetical protein HQK77_03895 [Desulfobacterales bacterium]|nr:hypothetical protein [Desulfobacterales bacterium]
MSEKNNHHIKVYIPIFDPEPSSRFASNVLEHTKIQGVLIGRFAVWAWVSDPGKQEFTKDIDIAIKRKDITKLMTYLNENNYKIQELSIGGINVTDIEKNIKVDFIYRYSKEWGDLSPLFEEAVTKSIEINNQVVICERTFWLVPADYLITMKIATMEKKDEDDAKRLLEHIDIDIDGLRILVEKFLGPMGMAKLENLLRELGHSKARSRGKYIS